MVPGVVTQKPAEPELSGCDTGAEASSLQRFPIIAAEPVRRWPHRLVTIRNASKPRSNVLRGFTGRWAYGITEILSVVPRPSWY